MGWNFCDALAIGNSALRFGLVRHWLLLRFVVVVLTETILGAHTIPVVHTLFSSPVTSSRV
jgi:hypothetical protein